MQIKVTPLTGSFITNPEVLRENGFVREALAQDPDLIGEFAGRACYQAFDKPNPLTRGNRDYLNNILFLGHESVLEHATIGFYVEGVSRNLLLELERHRHLSFSVLSTRYVDPDKYDLAVHPDVPDDFVGELRGLDAALRDLERRIFEHLTAAGKSKKEARTASRSVMLGCSETKFVVSANLRAWRYVIKLRRDPAADTEIRKFAEAVFTQLDRIAPASVQDMRENPQ